jgi:BRCT domain type II-containing protein
MTGVFDKLDRNDFKEMVVANGGKVCSGISKKTNLVLMGDGAGPSKVEAIENLKNSGFKIDVYTPATLSDFLDLLK